MRNNLSFIRTAVAAALALPGLAAAAETHRCSGVYDDAQRLACYDTTFGKPARPTTANAPAAAVVATPVPVEQRSASAPAAAAVAPPAPAAAASAPAQPVSGRITAVSRLPAERFAVTLDNGQVWTQLERDLSAQVSVGDTVQIRRAMLGSWMLETRGGVKTRVKPAR